MENAAGRACGLLSSCRELRCAGLRGPGYESDVDQRRFAAVCRGEGGRSTVVGITFPQAQGWSTALQGWRENRVLRQPLLIEVEQAVASGPPRVKFAERVAEVEHETVHEPPDLPALRLFRWMASGI